MDSCSPRHVILFLSLWANSQFLQQILSIFRCAVKGSRRMGRACRSAQLFQPCSPSFYVSSSPLIQPLRASTAEVFHMKKVQWFSSGAILCLLPLGEQMQHICCAGWKGQRWCSSVSQTHTSSPSLLQNFPLALACLSSWKKDLPLCFSICTIMSVKFTALYPSPVFVKPLRNVIS